MTREEVFQLKLGDKVKVLKTSTGSTHLGRITAGPRSGYYVSTGDILTVSGVSSKNYHPQVRFEEFGDQGYPYATPSMIELEGPKRTPLEHMNAEKDKLIEEISEMNLKLDRLKSKIEFMKEHGMQEFDENMWKAYHILKIAGSEDSEINQAKAIAQLLEK